MKTKMNSILLCICIVLPFCAHSQYTRNSQFVNDTFEQGGVVRTNGAREGGKLNFDASKQQFMFLSGEELMQLSTPSTISSVTIGPRYFIPILSGVFCEVIPLEGSDNLYVNWKLLSVSRTPRGAYGDAGANASVSEQAYVTPTIGESVLLQDRNEYNYRYANVYYLKVNNKYKAFTSTKSLCKIFKKQKSQIEHFASENKTEYGNLDDVTAIVKYAYSLQE